MYIKYFDFVVVAVFHNGKLAVFLKMIMLSTFIYFTGYLEEVFQQNLMQRDLFI